MLFAENQNNLGSLGLIRIVVILLENALDGVNRKRREEDQATMQERPPTTTTTNDEFLMMRIAVHSSQTMTRKQMKQNSVKTERKKERKNDERVCLCFFNSNSAV